MLTDNKKTRKQTTEFDAVKHYFAVVQAFFFFFYSAECVISDSKKEQIPVLIMALSFSSVLLCSLVTHLLLHAALTSLCLTL